MNRKTLLAGLLVFAALAAAFAARIGAQPPRSRPAPVERTPLVVKRDIADKRTILRGDTASGRESVLYRSSKDVVSQVRVSSDSRYTAAVETTDGEVAEDGENAGEYIVPPRNELVILDPRGREVCRVAKDVQTYTFSPDGKRLAFIAGSYYEGGVGFKPEGTYVLDVATCRQTRTRGIDQAYELHWLQSPTEDAIFARTLARRPAERVQRYEPATRTVRRVPSGAFHHSPDGQYYLKRPYELIESGDCRPGERSGVEDCLRVFERQSGRTVTLPPAGERGRDLGWVSGQGHLLLFSKRQEVRQETTERRGRLTVRGQLMQRPSRVDNTVWDVAQAREVTKFAGVPLVSTLREAAPGEWIAGGAELRTLPADASQDLRRLDVQRLDVQRLDVQRLDPRRRPVAPPPNR